MQQLSEFVVNHWVLVTAFCVVAGLLIANLMHTTGGVSPQDAVMLINREGAVVVDVRAPAEFEQGHISGAINVPRDELGRAAGRLQRHKGKPVLVCCASGTSGGTAARELRGMGWEDVRVIAGGIGAWRSANLPLAAG